MDIELMRDTTKRPSMKRLLAAFSRSESDRVPNFEFVIMRRNTEAILGAARVADVAERYRRLDTVWPARSKGEESDRSALAAYSAYLPAEEYQDLLEATGQDAAVCTLSWKPKSRAPSRSDIIARAQDGIISGRDELDQLPAPPSVDAMMKPLDYYIDAFRDTDIGVGVLVRSVFCNSYETLGIENFMLKMYDDPGVIEKLFDLFQEYSVAITRAAAERDVDFLAVDDDLCDNNGFMVNPDFLRDQWVGRTLEIIRPFAEKGIPVVSHCCGNIMKFTPMAIEMGFSAIHPIQPNCNDIYELKRRYGRDICLIGNIDLAGVLTQGTPEQVRADTLEHLERLAVGGGYVVASSHSITDDVPPENYRAMIETAQSFGGNA